MNLVAHQVLSFNNEKIQVGNFLGEFVRGRKYENYEAEIKKGILLHRRIDSFTDSNELVHKAIKIFSPNHRKFAPIIVDVLFDYILISNWNLYRTDSFLDFIKNTYKILRKHEQIYAKNELEYLNTMISENWYLRYSTIEGIELTLFQISQRAKFFTEMHTAIKEVYLHENELNDIFFEFYEQLELFCKDLIQQNL